jgi:hypothetical protein
MANEETPRTDFGQGGVGSEKEGFVGMDRGVLPDEAKLPDENPTLMTDDGSLRETDSGETREGEPDAGEGTSTSLTDALRHSGRSGGEASIAD